MPFALQQQSKLQGEINLWLNEATFQQVFFIKHLFGISLCIFSCEDAINYKSMEAHLTTRWF